MPIYEFHCKACRRDFKTLRAREEPTAARCPNCRSERAAPLLSVTARVASSENASLSACALPTGGGCRMEPGAGGCACRG